MPGAVRCFVLMVSVDEPDPGPSETLLELRLSVGACVDPLGEETADRETVPANPLILARFIVTVPLLPAAKLREPTFVLRLKSCTLTVIVNV